MGEGKDSGQERMDRCATHSYNARNCASEECSGRFTAFTIYSLVNALNERISLLPQQFPATAVTRVL
jgi:hypothetical protein